jgi:hypothetical protein
MSSLTAPLVVGALVVVALVVIWTLRRRNARNRLRETLRGERSVVARRLSESGLSREAKRARMNLAGGDGTQGLQVVPGRRESAPER